MCDRGVHMGAAWGEGVRRAARTTRSWVRRVACDETGRGCAGAGTDVGNLCIMILLLGWRTVKVFVHPFIRQFQSFGDISRQSRSFIHLEDGEGVRRVIIL